MERRLTRLVVGLAVAVVVWVAAVGPTAADDAPPPITDRDIDAAIDRLRTWLYEEQDPETGGWDDPGWRELDGQAYHLTAETALVLYALLSSGESFQDPRLAKAIDYLKANPTNSTYLASMRAHIWAALPDEFLPRLREEAEYLESAERDGKFYYQTGSPFGSNSLTQYGVLGMWEHRKRGGEVSEAFWNRVADYMLTQQQPDGGWLYDPRRTRLRGGQSTASMTSAGVVILQIIQQELARDRRQPDPRLETAINDGLAWLDERFDPAENTGYGDGRRFRYYTLYGIERIALASGISRFNGRDWFEAGARFILEQEDGRGHVNTDSRDDNTRRIDTAFALLFLSRGRIPMWVSKLQVPGVAWNNRPNDLYFLTRYLSDQREAELNWQVVPIDGDPADWLRTPVLFFSTDEPVAFTDEQKAKLKRYLDSGGKLLVNPEGQRRQVRRSIEALARELYPDYAFETVDGRHPLADVIVDLTSGSGRLRPRLEAMSNGVRDLILLPRDDWGLDFQTDTPGRGDAWGYASNIYASATDRGTLTSRLEAPLPERDPSREPTGTITVVRGQHGGNWNAEPLALEIAGVDLFNQTGRTLEVEARPLAELGDGAVVPDLVHLTDPDTTELTDAELDALARYVSEGGTVLVESAGGLGRFADDVGAQLAERLGGERRWLDPPHPILDGHGLDNGVDATRVTYRTYSHAIGSPGDRPNLAAVFVDGRAAVILSPRDLSLGAMGARAYRVNGYATDSARALWRNLMLWAAGD